MAMNFWQSTHYLYWIKDLTRSDLAKRNPLDKKHLTEQEIDAIHLANISLLEELGPLCRVRHVIIYTAIIFYRRFYLSQSFYNFDPHLVVATVFFLSSKVEESQLSLTMVTQMIHRLTTTRVDDDESVYTFQEKDIIECEFYVLEALHFDLILYHPFQPLLVFLDEYDLHDDCLTFAWQMVQFSYRTDVIMLYPPFMIAYAAAFMACAQAGYNAHEVFANVNLKKDMVLKIISELQEAVEQTRQLYPVQSGAFEKLEEILPDPTSLSSSDGADKASTPNSSSTAAAAAASRE